MLHRIVSIASDEIIEARPAIYPRVARTGVAKLDVASAVELEARLADDRGGPVGRELAHETPPSVTGDRTEAIEHQDSPDEGARDVADAARAEFQVLVGNGVYADECGHSLRSARNRAHHEACPWRNVQFTRSCCAQ